jgi:orotate phosphoribosyltransferase
VDVPYSAVQYVKSELGLQVCHVATLSDLLGYLQSQSGSGLQAHADAVAAYRAQYGV